MDSRHLLSALALISLGACGTGITDISAEPEAAAQPDAVPENVLLLAAPGQNLQTARLNPEDQCYWYIHNGPVETTEIPLRSNRGRHICLVEDVAPAV